VGKLYNVLLVPFLYKKLIYLESYDRNIEVIYMKVWISVNLDLNIRELLIKQIVEILNDLKNTFEV